VIMEDLREVCLYKKLAAKGKKPLWWRYMKYVHKLCYEEVTEECSKNGHVVVAESYAETMDCVRDSFEGPNMQKDDNTILRNDVAAWKKYGHGYWPSVVINERTFRGDLTPDNVM